MNGKRSSRDISPTNAKQTKQLRTQSKTQRNNNGIEQRGKANWKPEHGKERRKRLNKNNGETTETQHRKQQRITKETNNGNIN